MMNSFWWGTKEGGIKGIRWLSWANMSMSKSSGGLGFRDLYGFNLALLGKHCWSLINNPNSLVARVFKLDTMQILICLRLAEAEGIISSGLVFGRLKKL